MLSGVLGKEIKIRLAIPPKLGSLEADAGLLQAALVNLALNARDAMPGGGELTIEAIHLGVAENMGSESQENSPDDEVRPGDYITLAISDTGCGIAPDALPRVFEPFFTTKEVGKGTGLGLSAVYGFAKQSNGYVDISSEVGRGTRVELTLPMIAGTERGSAAGRSDPG
jgi:signal transduction histidine kinase